MTRKLFGRHAELSRLDDLLGQATHNGGCLVLCGEPGIGKSSLLDAAASSAAAHGHRVVRASGVQTEATLPFAALQQILHPMAAHVDGLPATQQAALRGALGQLDDVAPEPFLVALAALGVLCAEATGAPLAILVDDAHWIDPASADALAFVARRLQADPIVLLAAIRPGYNSALLDAHLPVLDLSGLDDSTSDQLLRARNPRLDDRIRAEVLRAAQGNPLALVELPLTVGQPAGAHVQPITDRLERSFAARFGELGPATRLAVTICAAHDGGDLHEVLTAATRADPAVTSAVLTPAVDGGLIAVDNDRITFRHPLVRSAIYQAASQEDRRTAHAVLARTLVDDPERQAWHLAAGSTGHDERVAATMEQAAVMAGQRGSAAVSAAAWERAAALTPDATTRAGRYLHAAELAVELGQAGRAARLLGEFDKAGADQDPGRQARAALVRDAIEPGTPGDPSRIRTLVDLAGAVEVGLATRLLLAAAAHTWTADPGPEAHQHLVNAIDRLPGPADDPFRLTMLGFADPSRHAAAIRARVARLRPDDLDAGSSALVTSVFLTGADPALTALQAKVVENLRATGRFRALPHPLITYAWQSIALADWQSALPAADESHRIATETGQPMWAASAVLVQAVIAGLRGDDGTADTLATQAEAIVLPLRMNPFLCGIQFVRGLSAIGAGRYDVAFTQLRRMFEPADPSFHPVQSTWALGDLAESAVHTGRTDEARDVMARFAPRPGTTASPWTEAAALYARPFLATDDTAEQAFQQALSSGLSRWPWYRARLLLEYGTWLRRRKRLVDSRGPLRSARDACDALGLRSWADRARRELRAAGEDSPHGTEAVWAVLSPQELQIAQLAAAGHSNKEIAERLYLSERTVASHLYRTYPKLGIKSRTKLHSVLGKENPEA